MKYTYITKVEQSKLNDTHWHYFTWYYTYNLKNNYKLFKKTNTPSVLGPLQPTQYDHIVSKFMLFGKVIVKTNINRGNAKNYKIISHDSKWRVV